jgi:hypothetical protein
MFFATATQVILSYLEHELFENKSNLQISHHVMLISHSGWNFDNILQCK